MTAYATKRDVFRYGLARGALGTDSREVASSLAATNVLTLEQHGFETDDAVILRAAEGGTLSAPLVAGTTYYVRRLNDSTFSLAATAGGAAIDLTSNGETVIVSIPLPFDEILELYSRFVDNNIPAHAVPLAAPYPVTIIAIVAELAAKKLQSLSGVTSVSVNEAEAAARLQLKEWAAGIPIRDSRMTTARTNLAITSSLASVADPRGWGSGSLP